MFEPKPSTLLASPSGRAKRRAVLARCLALPLLVWGLPGCGGSAHDSQVTGAGGSISTGYAGGPVLMLPPVGTSGASSMGSGGAGSGAYVLPPDFSKAQMGGFKLGPAIDPTAMGSAGSGAGGDSGATCGTQILGVVRDFRGVNETGGHPDFEAFKGSAPSLGIVKVALGMDQKPEYAGVGPIIDPRNGQQSTSKMAFDQWYRATPGVNEPYLIYFYFQPNAGVLTFQSNAFFPLDGQGWGNTCSYPDATCRKQDHNFGFTTEVHTQFNYRGKETFSFTGDDDLWVFINHKLAIDLGGLHAQATQTISLDTEAQSLGISVGGTFDLDLFHAERHTENSNFRVDTNLAFTNCGTIVDEPPVK